MKLSSAWKLVISFAATFAAAAVGSAVTFTAIPTWYESLNKTVLTPPNWVFGPVWTLLYILMAIAVFLVWRVENHEVAVRHRLILFAEQLMLNALWSIIFFGQHQIFLAFVTIIVLWLTILVTIIAFYKLSKPAALLLVPYFLWVSFAGVLNYLVWTVNR